jgi:hypothetical protein
LGETGNYVTRLLFDRLTDELATYSAAAVAGATNQIVSTSHVRNGGVPRSGRRPARGGEARRREVVLRLGGLRRFDGSRRAASDGLAVGQGVTLRMPLAGDRA